MKPLNRFIISTIAIVFALVLLLFHLFGIVNPTRGQIMELLDTQLLSYRDNIKNDYDKIAAHAISFSEQLETSLQQYLTENDLSFDDLENNPDALSDLQNHLYNVVYLNMQLAPASGVFYILDTTVNSHSDQSFYNGIYLKYININSENTVNNEISLYRGAYSTGKKNNLSFHSGWQNEMQTNFFDNSNSLFAENPHYILSPITEIPETWERARYLYVPIHDAKDNIIGICGFEVNDLYFQLSENINDDKLGQIIGGLLDHRETTYSGQFNSSRYNIPNSNLQTKEKKRITEFTFDTETCIGKTQTLQLGKDTFTVAIMLTESQYKSLLKKNQTKTIVITLLIMLLALVYCIFLGKKYFFYEKKLRALEKAQKLAEEEVARTKLAYEKALEDYTLAQQELQHLANEQKKEIVLEDFEFFLCNLNTLSPTEYKIYELYLSGKSANEITDILQIKKNTLKYHNKNIYSKLGVSSRKQLLRFAALKQHQDKN